MLLESGISRHTTGKWWKWWRYRSWNRLHRLCDDRLYNCATVDSEIGLLSETVNRDSDIEIDNQTPSETVTFFNAGLETVKSYIMQHDVNDTIFSSLHKVGKELFWVMNQENSQTSLHQYFQISN